jgi:hypothetical protein
MKIYKYIIGIAIIYIIYLLYKTREGFDNNIINIFNDKHMGDCMFMMVYLHKIKEHLAETGKHIKFYINQTYIDQIREFVPYVSNKAIVTIYPLEDKPADAHDVWIMHTYNLPNNPPEFFQFLTHHSNRIANSIFKAPTITDFIYDDPTLEERYNNLNPAKYHNVDFLIINSKPQSGQYNYNEDEWRTAVEDLGRLYKIVTTLKVNDIPCTMDDKLTIKDIAAIASHANHVIAVNTGPIVGCFNKTALQNVKKWYVFDNNNYYTYPTIVNVKDFDEIRREFL